MAIAQNNPITASDVIEALNNLTSRTRRNITNDLANLTTAIAEQNLEKYGYKIGDYFMGPSGYQYNLADMDSYYGGYDLTAVVGTHHCGIVVDTKSYCKWAASGTASYYSKSDLHAFLTGTVLNNIKNDMIALFGGTTGLEHLLSHRETDHEANETGTSLHTSYIYALSEVQTYGANVFSSDAYQTGTACKQLELFSKYRFNEIFGRTDIWLQTLKSTSTACLANKDGIAGFEFVRNSMRVCGYILFH